MIVYVLDAHALVWMLEGNARLGASARAVLSDPKSNLILPATALAEACWVVGKARTALTNWHAVIKAVQADPRIRLAALDLTVIMRAMSLPPPLEMHDAQIVATALTEQDKGHDVKILTRDQAITDSG